MNRRVIFIPKDDKIELLVIIGGKKANFASYRIYLNNNLTELEIEQQIINSTTICHKIYVESILFEHSLLYRRTSTIFKFNRYIDKLKNKLKNYGRY